MGERFGPKGSSIILFKNEKFRQKHFFVYKNWSGGFYSSPSVSGSRPGGIIASAWATMVLLGKSGYTEIAKQIHETHTQLVKGINQIEGLKIVGNSVCCSVSFVNKKGDPKEIYLVAHAMKEKGWSSVNYAQNPVCCQIQVGARSAFNAIEFVRDVKSCWEEICKNPQKFARQRGTIGGIYGMNVDFSPEDIDNRLLSFLSATFKPPKPLKRVSKL